jgi:hypothetical protein
MALRGPLSTSTISSFIPLFTISTLPVIHICDPLMAPLATLLKLSFGPYTVTAMVPARMCLEVASLVTTAFVAQPKMKFMSMPLAPPLFW